MFKNRRYPNVLHTSQGVVNCDEQLTALNPRYFLTRKTTIHLCPCSENSMAKPLSASQRVVDLIRSDFEGVFDKEEFDEDFFFCSAFLSSIFLRISISSSSRDLGLSCSGAAHSLSRVSGVGLGALVLELVLVFVRTVSRLNDS